MRTLIFLGWDDPACHSVARALLDLREREGDLFRHTVIVPTRRSGLNLRRELVSRSDSKALLMPDIMTVDQLLHVPCSDDVMSSLEELACWTEVLHASDIHVDFPVLFPKPMSSEDLPSLMDIASNMRKLRRDLSKQGLSVGDVEEQADEERDRWRDIARLNALYEQETARRGKVDSSTAFLSHLASPLAGESIAARGGKLITACLADLSRPVRKVLEMLAAQGMEVENWVHAPEWMQGRFDEWGCPLTHPWAECNIEIAPGQISSCADPAALAGEACRLIGESALPGQAPDAGLGVCDTAFFPAVRAELAAVSWKIYQPMERPYASTAVYRVLDLLRRNMDEEGYSESFEALMTSKLLADSLGIGNQERCCRVMDRIRQEHIPEWERYLMKLAGEENPSVASSFAKLADWRDELEQDGQLGRSIRNWCERLGELGDYRDLAEEIDICRDHAATLELLQQSEGLFSSKENAMLLLMGALGAETVPHPQRGEDLAALGWLELQFAPEKTLVVTGMHDGIVPEGGVEHQFLPESLKRKLDIETFARKTARDAYLLTALAESRKSGSRSLHLLVSRTNPNNDPGTPSSLLLRCEGRALIDRVALLFGESAESSPRSDMYQRGGWHYLDLASKSSALTIHEMVPGFVNPWIKGLETRSFSPSTIKKYLACPFRFWMELALFGGRTPQDFNDDKQVMDAREQGNIIHSVLQAFVGRFPGRETLPVHEAESAMAAEILKLVEYHFTKQYGQEPSAYLVQQKRNLQGRMIRFAQQHLDELERGWCAVELEKEVKGNWEGYPVNLKIDRIDVNREQGAIRIIDYKSSTASPESRHLEATDNEHPFSPVVDLAAPPKKARGRKDFRRWTDLQLPFYMLSASRMLNRGEGCTLSAAYWNMPADLDKIGLQTWEELSIHADGTYSPLLGSAREWLMALMHTISEGRGTVCAEELGYPPPPFSPFESLIAPNMETVKDLFGMGIARQEGRLA